jgi:hypothetical protein
MEETSLEVATPENKPLAVSCNNCGKFINSRQQRLDIYNTRHKKFEHYHETHNGCYESSQNAKIRIIRNRFKPWLNVHDTYAETVEPYNLGYET